MGNKSPNATARGYVRPTRMKNRPVGRAYLRAVVSNRKKANSRNKVKNRDRAGETNRISPAKHKAKGNKRHSPEKVNQINPGKGSAKVKANKARRLTVK